MARERWTRRALVGTWIAALAVAGGSCVGQPPTLPCAEDGDPGEQGRLLCPDPGDGNGSPICIDPTLDSRNCGTCGNVCTPGQYCRASACAYPTSCADLLTLAGPAADGEYVIQPAMEKAFTVYCAGMSTATPTEYLTLVRTYGNGLTTANFSGYNCSNCMAAASTYFEKVRIDPASLQVDVTDRTYTTLVTNDPMCWATIGGACMDGRMNRFAEAGNCLPKGPATPANIDLRGTPFSIAPSVYIVLEGWQTYNGGPPIWSPDRKVVDFSGGGDCGAGHPYEWIVQLAQD